MKPLPWLIILLLADLALFAYAVFVGLPRGNADFGLFELLVAAHSLITFSLGTLAWFQLFSSAGHFAFLFIAPFIFIRQPLATWPLALLAIIKILFQRRKTQNPAPSPTDAVTDPEPSDPIT